jgi:hypothetical protein
MTGSLDVSKRQLVQTAGLTMVGGLVAATSDLILPANAEGAKPGARAADEITPPEDLMREHGVLDRVMLVYEEGLHKFAANEDFDTFVLLDSAQVVKDFIEDYHERAEEKELFPRFRRANQLTDLVEVLSASTRRAGCSRAPSCRPRQAVERTARTGTN